MEESALWIGYFFFHGSLALVGHGLLIVAVFRSHTTTHHSRYNSSGQVTSPTQRILPYNTQHARETDIHAPARIRNRNISKRAATDPRLRKSGHGDQPLTRYLVKMHNSIDIVYGLAICVSIQGGENRFFPSPTHLDRPWEAFHSN